MFIVRVCRARLVTGTKRASLVSLTLACAAESKSMPIVVSLSGSTGTHSKRNFHRPESNCGMALNSGCRAFIVFQSQLRLRIQSPRQSTGSVPQTRKKCSNLSFQESDFSSCHFLKRSKIDILGNLKFFCECLERSTTTVGCDPCPF